MATIPIEVIIQDAESPVTPTPESGGETNITVPDTGTLSDVSNSGGISSSASIVLPAIIAVLAIGAIVVMLVHKHHKHQNGKLSRKEKLATVASSTIAILAATVLVGNLVIPATKAAASVEPGTADLDVVDKITITATREQDSDTITTTVKDTSYATANLDFGYKVTASMTKGTTTANLYLDGNIDSPYYIAPVSGGILTDNTWGYTLTEPTEESSYLSIPLSTKPTNIVKEVAKTVEDTAVNIYYTVQIDKDMPNGTYTGELEYTIAPAIEYMQDFSTLTSAEKTATLARITEGKQYILKDNRDENPYYISKLKDNNVWMTQNLDLDIDENTTYTHVDTDLGWSDLAHPDPTAKWKPDEGHSTITFTAGEGATVEGWESSPTAPYSANPGDVYYYTSGNDGPDIFFDSQQACERIHTDGSCAHYHAGNYYNWSAAVASNDSSSLTMQYDNAANSICPAGWRLQDGPAINDRDYSDLANLAKSIDVLENNIHEACGGTCNYYDYLAGGFISIRTGSAWLVRSGNVGEGALLERAGNYAGYWTRTNNGDNLGFRLSFSSSRFTPAAGSLKNQGFSIRCLAR